MRSPASSSSARDEWEGRQGQVRGDIVGSGGQEDSGIRIFDVTVTSTRPTSVFAPNLVARLEIMVDQASKRPRDPRDAVKDKAAEDRSGGARGHDGGKAVVLGTQGRGPGRGAIGPEAWGIRSACRRNGEREEGGRKPARSEKTPGNENPFNHTEAWRARAALALALRAAAPAARGRLLEGPSLLDAAHGRGEPRPPHAHGGDPGELEAEKSVKVLRPKLYMGSGARARGKRQDHQAHPRRRRRQAGHAPGGVK